MQAANASALAGIIGWPVAQSRSPAIQNFWLEQHGIADRYVLLPVTEDQLERALRGLAVFGFRGCNVTMPHKQAVMPLLDRVDPMSQRIGAVNTIAVQEDGTLRGFNNDGVGFVQSLYDAKPGWRPDAGPIQFLNLQVKEDQLLQFLPLIERSEVCLVVDRCGRPAPSHGLDRADRLRAAPAAGRDRPAGQGQPA